MKTITFTHSFTFPEDSVLGFAAFLGYQDTIADTTQSPTVFSQNTETAVDFVTRKSKEHSLIFTTKWAKFLVDQEVKRQAAVIQAQFQDAIVKPVIDALVVTSTVNE